MPRALERKLKATARARGYGKRRTAAYVYGNKAMQAYRKAKKR